MIGRALLAIVAFALLLLPRWLDIYWLNIGITVMVWAALASAWNIAGGLAGALSLGHAAFLGIGAYTATLLFLQLGVSPWFGMFIGAALAALLGAFLGLITLRLRGPFFVLATLAFGMAVHIIVVNWRSLTRGAAGLLLPFQGGATNMLFAEFSAYWYLAAGTLALTLLIVRMITRAPLGYFLAALREDEEAARALGVRVVVSKVSALTLSAGMTALIGAVYATFLQYIDPTVTTDFDLSVRLALIAIVGGAHSVLGPTVGALIIIPLSEFLRARVGGGPALVIYGVMLSVIVLIAPQGVIGLLERLRPHWRRYARAR